MLVAEGVTGPEKGTDSAVMSAVTRAASLSDVQESPIEHMDYRTKLAQIRQIYQAEFEKYEQVLNTKAHRGVCMIQTATANPGFCQLGPCTSCSCSKPKSSAFCMVQNPSSRLSSIMSAAALCNIILWKRMTALNATTVESITASVLSPENTTFQF